MLSKLLIIPQKTKKSMPSAPTEILSYESRTSIGDKIRKEGVFRNKRLAILFHLALYIYRRGAKCASSHFCVATELLDEIMIIQRKISSAAIWCNLRLQNAVLCKNKTKHCVQTLFWPTICLSAKKIKKLSVPFLPLTLNERNMANSPISTKCRGKNYNLCFRSDYCFVKYTYGNYFITK